MLESRVDEITFFTSNLFLPSASPLAPAFEILDLGGASVISTSAMLDVMGRICSIERADRVPVQGCLNKTLCLAEHRETGPVLMYWYRVREVRG